MFRREFFPVIRAMPGGFNSRYRLPSCSDQIILHTAERPGPRYPGHTHIPPSEKNNELTNLQRAAHEWKVNFDLMNKYREHVKAGLIFGCHTQSNEWRNSRWRNAFDEMPRQVDEELPLPTRLEHNFLVGRDGTYAGAKTGGLKLSAM